MSHRFVGQSGPARPVTFKNPEFLSSYASVAGLSELGSQAGSQAPRRAPSDVEAYWARVDGAFNRVLAFFESPNRSLTPMDFDFLAGLSSAYADMLAFYSTWAKDCGNEGFYKGLLAYSAEVFAHAYKALAGDEIGKAFTYIEVLDDLKQILDKMFKRCKDLHGRISSGTGG